MTVRARRSVRDLWKLMLGWGVLILVLGILMLVRPHASIVFAATLLASFLVLSGIAEMVLAAVVDASAAGRAPLFFTGALSMALGVLAFRHFGYASAVLLLALAIGAVFVFEGISDIALALEDPSLPDRGWYIVLGIIEVTAGIVMLAWPFRSLAAATVVAGVCLVAIGLDRICWALLARRALSRVQTHAGRLAASSAPSAQRSSARDITTR